jgi:hypothetical protein
MGTIKNSINYWLVIDREIVPCGKYFAEAFINLFSSFYILNLNYPQYLAGFYGFFEKCVFEIKVFSPAVTAFRASLESLRTLAIKP